MASTKEDQILEAVMALTRQGGEHTSQLAAIRDHLRDLNGSVARNTKDIVNIQTTCARRLETRTAAEQASEKANAKWEKYLKWPLWGAGAMFAAEAMNHGGQWLKAWQVLRP
jgi:TolA-binding protein